MIAGTILHAGRYINLCGVDSDVISCQGTLLVVSDVYHIS